MNEKFDNFGQALAWMMESPENVAVAALSGRYRWLGKLEFHAECWMPSVCKLELLAEYRWSRAPREPLEFRGFGVSSASGWLMHVQIDDESVNDIRCDALSRVPCGTEFELILKEKVK